MGEEQPLTGPSQDEGPELGQQDRKQREATRPRQAALCKTLFWTFLKVGAFTFGGGYAMIPLIRQELVSVRRLMSDDDFVDALAVVQCSPGAVAINTAVFVGQKLAGLPGALSATLGASIPSFVILLIIAMALGRVATGKTLEAIFAGVRPAVVALIATAALKLTRTAIRNLADLGVAVAGLLALSVLHAHPAIVIVAAIVTGLALSGAGHLAARRRHNDIS